MLVDNVHTSSHTRKLEELDQNRCAHLRIIREKVNKLIAQESAMKTDDDDMVLITREQFHRWLELPDMHKLLENIDIQTSCRGELFDVFDLDGNGDLYLNELFVGLMRMRGQITKTDIVSIRLSVRKMSYIVSELYDALICSNALHASDDGAGANHTDPTMQ